MKSFSEFSEQAYSSKAQLDEGIGSLLKLGAKALIKAAPKATKVVKPAVQKATNKVVKPAVKKATGALSSLGTAIKGKPPGPYAGKAPRPPKFDNLSKEIWNTNTGKYDVVKNTDKGWDWAQRALKDEGPNSFKNYAQTGEMPSGLKGWRPLQGFDLRRPASKGGPGSMPTPQVMTPAGLAAAGGAALGGVGVGNVISNEVRKRLSGN